VGATTALHPQHLIEYTVTIITVQLVGFLVRNMVLLFSLLLQTVMFLLAVLYTYETQSLIVQSVE
jgi:hypothetical protein